jgi:hypothetical protein
VNLRCQRIDARLYGFRLHNYQFIESSGYAAKLPWKRERAFVLPVLVVDDDPLVLLVTCSMLEDLSSPAKWSMLRFSF